MTEEKPFHRRSIRLADADYSEPGGYFLTICAAGRRQIFGRIESDRVVLSQLGEVVRKCWLQIPEHFPQASLEEFVVMPNHLHGIIGLHSRKRNGEAPVGARYIVPSFCEGTYSRGIPEARERLHPNDHQNIQSSRNKGGAEVPRMERRTLAKELFRARVAGRERLRGREPLYFGEPHAMEMG